MKNTLYDLTLDDTVTSSEMGLAINLHTDLLGIQVDTCKVLHFYAYGLRRYCMGSKGVGQLNAPLGASRVAPTPAPSAVLTGVSRSVKRF